MAVARALPADGDVPETVEVLPQGQLVEEVVGGRLQMGFVDGHTSNSPGLNGDYLILRAHSQSLHPDPDEPGEGEVDEGARGTRRSGPPVHKAGWAF